MCHAFGDATGALMTDELDLAQASEAVADQTTRGAALQDIAARYPDLWPMIAQHPNAYPKLLRWLSEVGDENVKGIALARLDTSTSQLPDLPPVPDMPADLPAVTDMPQDLPPVSDAPPNRPWHIGSAQPTRHTGMSTAMKLVIGFVALAVLLGAGITVFVLVSNNLNGGPPPISTNVWTQPATDNAEPNQDYSTQPEPEPTTDVDPEMEAQRQLKAQIDSDADFVAYQLQDQWTTQLSAKKYGVKWEGHSWTYQDIWNEFLQLQARYPMAAMVQPSQYASFNLGPEWYVTVSGLTFSSPDAALNWCSSQGLSDGYCFALRITNTHGTNSKHKR